MPNKYNFPALKDDLEILDQFELFVEEWYSERTTPPNKHDIRATDFNLTVPVPHTLSRYWDICRRFPKSTISGLHGTGERHLETEDSFVKFAKNRNQAMGRGPNAEKSKFPDDPDDILRYATQSCGCCFSGLHRDENGQWNHYEFDSHKIDPDMPTLINSLMTMGLKSITSTWESELDDGEFQPLRYEAQTIWRTDAEWEYWYHPDGFLGRTRFDFFYKKRKGILHWIAPRTMVARKKLIGR